MESESITRNGSCKETMVDNLSIDAGIMPEKINSVGDECSKQSEENISDEFNAVLANSVAEALRRKRGK